MKMVALFCFILIASLLIVIVIQSRNLHCGNYGERESAICRQVQKQLVWGWKGLEGPPPGWQISFNAMREVYCDAGITPKDIPVLKKIADVSDDNLRMSALSLLTLLKTRPDATDRLPGDAYSSGLSFDNKLYLQESDTGENSIFNPKNPHYILKAGCK